MAKSANLYARIEPDLKEQAESILSALGIPASNAITMFYKQIILQKGLPFEVKPGDSSGRYQRSYRGAAERRAGERICDDTAGRTRAVKVFLKASARTMAYDL